MCYGGLNNDAPPPDLYAWITGPNLVELFGKG